GGGARRRQSGLDALGERMNIDAGRSKRTVQRRRSGGHLAGLVGREEQHQLADASAKRSAHGALRRRFTAPIEITRVGNRSNRTAAGCKTASSDSALRRTEINGSADPR